MLHLTSILSKIKNKENNIFDNFIIILIVLSAIVLGLETDAGLMIQFGDYFRFFDSALLGVFGIEIIIRIYANYPAVKRYYTDPWNIFDVTVFALCALPHVISLGFSSVDAFYAIRLFRLLRALKAFRVLKIIPRFRQLQLLITTLFGSLPAMGFVIVLLGVFFYLFAIIGHSLFGNIDSTHFSSLPNSLLTLFEAATGQWSDTMELIVSNAHNEFYNYITPIYFVLFYFIAGLIILNLFIGIIVNEMQKAQDDQKRENIRSKLQNDLDAGTLNLIDEIAGLNSTINEKLDNLYNMLDKNK